MEKFINSKNKRLIGWDEIIHGGLAPNATVMFWIGMGAVPETVKKGYDVIMTPMTPCYLDHGDPTRTNHLRRDPAKAFPSRLEAKEGQSPRHQQSFPQHLCIR